jgi:hypothetical protein
MVPIDEHWARRELMVAFKNRDLLTKQAASLVDFLLGEAEP